MKFINLFFWGWLLLILGFSADCATYQGVITGNWSNRTTWAVAKTGTITTTTSSTSVTGTNTLFTTEFQVGDKIYNSSFVLIGTIATIVSNTSLTLASNATTA